MRPRLLPALLALLALVAGCALYSDVLISPLIYIPANIERGGDVASMVRKYDYVNAVLQAPAVDSRSRPNAVELAALGAAEYTSGRFDSARRHLRAALDLQPFRATYAQVAWDLSQLEYMANNYEASLDWAKTAIDHGIVIKPWHLAYLTSLRSIDVYHVTGKTAERVPMKMGRPDVPRISIRLNDKDTVTAMIDSGAVLSIASATLASTLPIRSLGTFEGTFSGLLGEPITVRFGIIDTIDIGGMRIGNVPVAIMPDEKMKFVVAGKKEFRMDLLLGAHLLKEFRIELDFRRDSATFIRIPASGRKPAGDQNLFFEAFRPAVRGTINRRGWFLFVLDTGSEVTFLNGRDRIALPLITTGSKMHNATLQGLGGAKKHGEKVENVELGVDRWAGTFKTLPMYESPPNERTAGILGENYLKNFDVIIDFGRMRLDLAPIGVLAYQDERPQIKDDLPGRQIPP